MRNTYKYLILTISSFVFILIMARDTMAYEPVDLQILREAVVGAMTGAIAAAESPIPSVPATTSPAATSAYYSYWHENRDLAEKHEYHDRSSSAKHNTLYREEHARAVVKRDDSSIKFHEPEQARFRTHRERPFIGDREVQWDA